MNNKSIELPGDVVVLLEKLAAEESKNPAELLCALIKKEDEKRHVVFNPKEKFIRVKCGLDQCFETRSSRGLDTRD